MDTQPAPQPQTPSQSTPQTTATSPIPQKKSTALWWILGCCSLMALGCMLSFLVFGYALLKSAKEVDTRTQTTTHSQPSDDYQSDYTY